MTEIASTHEMNEGAEFDDAITDMVATTEPVNEGIEFHVSMRSYTQRDMEDLIVQAAAQIIVGRHGERQMEKQVQERAVELIAKKADAVLASVTKDIIDQPIAQPYGKAPITMREFIGLTGREYLTAKVDRSSGNPSPDGYHAVQRIEYLVQRAMDRAFKSEIEKATNATLSEIRAAIKERHEALIAAERARFLQALSSAK